MTTRWLWAGVLLAFGAPLGAAEPPAPDDLDALLAREPVTEATWPTWRDRLRDWSYAPTDRTRPAYRAALVFVRPRLDDRNKSGKQLAKDPVAWLVLGRGFLDDPDPKRLAFARAQDAEKAFREALKRDNRFGPAHHALARAILEEERAESEADAGRKPNAGRLREARTHFAEARKFDPEAPRLTAREDAELALRAEQREEAERLFERAVHDDPGDEASARRLAALRKKTNPAPPAATPNPADSAFARVMAWFFGVYAVVMLLMAGAGLLLARRTRGPRAADLLGRAPAEMVARGQVLRTYHETWLTRLYAFALALSLTLFYLAIPFVLWGLLVVTLTILILGMFFRRDPASADVHTALLRASGGGMWAVFRALFASFGKGGFGVRKTPGECPRLYEALREVADRVDTDPVDEVYLAPGSGIGVHQEGRGPFGLLGTRRRVLTLGLSTMHFLTVSELKAILAHEYAHFSHKDTLWIRFIHQVTLSIERTTTGMRAVGGVATYFNPFYWFFYLYQKSYALLSSGFSRSREFLADRMACSLYGSDVFLKALEKVCTDGTLFEMTIYHNISVMLRERKAFVNMYLAFRRYREERFSETERQKLYRKLLDDEASLFASHPTFGERVRAARALPKGAKAESASALSLFEEPEEVERELTDFLTGVMAEARRRR